jgi:hypothetical protein
VEKSSELGGVWDPSRSLSGRAYALNQRKDQAAPAPARRSKSFSTASACCVRIDVVDGLAFLDLPERCPIAPGAGKAGEGGRLPSSANWTSPPLAFSTAPHSDFRSQATASMLALLRALAQRVEVDAKELRIMVSKTNCCARSSLSQTQKRQVLACPVLYRSGTLDTIRTCDLHLRRVARYPPELWARTNLHLRAAHGADDIFCIARDTHTRRVWRHRVAPSRPRRKRRVHW